MAIKELSLERSTSHRSLQVINDVKCVIRELVENSIDAGAKSIFVKLIDNGWTAIQVVDNGRGIRECNFEQLAMPNTTSKIQNFEDIFTSLTSHGFRGEALNSIANVGTLEVETRVAKDDMGWLLKFASDGKLTDKIQVVTKVGTSVTCRGLFEPYPVRRSMMLKNMKNSTSGCVSMVQQYALIHPDIRFSLTNTISSSNQIRNLFASTGTCKSIREVAQEVFGHSFSKSVVDVDIQCESWSIEGVISSPQTGRQSNDIQILFINSRPVDEMKKIKKCLKDVHRQFSSKHNVAFVLNLLIDYNNVDINLAPDKRKLFLLQEEVIMRQMKEKIVEYYLMLMARVSLSSDSRQLKQMLLPGAPTKEQTRGRANLDVVSEVDTSVYHSEPTQNVLEHGKRHLKGAQDSYVPGLSLQSTQEDYNDEIVREGEQDHRDGETGSTETHDDVNHLDAATQVYVKERGGSARTLVGETVTSGNMEIYELKEEPPGIQLMVDKEVLKETVELNFESIIEGMGHKEGVDTEKESHALDSMYSTQSIVPEVFRATEQFANFTQAQPHPEKASPLDQETSRMTEMPYSDFHVEANGVKQYNMNERAEYPEGVGDASPCNNEVNDSKEEQSLDSSCKGLFDEFIYSEKGHNDLQQLVLEATPGHDAPSNVETSYHDEQVVASDEEEDMCNDDILTIDMSRLYNDNQLTRINDRPSKWNYCSSSVPEITDSGMMDPTVFRRMKVCGQFNNGFIVAKLEGTEILTEEMKYSLYLIDPHAADEKTKFEIYNDTIKIVQQPLVVHKRVDLSPFHQQVVEANLDLLKENGFEVYVTHKSHDMEALNADANEPGVYLSSYPQLMGNILGEEDFISFVHDLANHGTSGTATLSNTETYKVLWGGKSIVPRPNRVWNILATKACKKAVKLGEPLSMKQMENIKNGLSDLIHPWNCPHGRPTMKCLITTEQLIYILK